VTLSLRAAKVLLRPAALTSVASSVSSEFEAMTSSTLVGCAIAKRTVRGQLLQLPHASRTPISQTAKGWIRHGARPDALKENGEWEGAGRTERGYVVMQARRPIRTTVIACPCLVQRHGIFH
jgi:hypothetical protein